MSRALLTVDVCDDFRIYEENSKQYVCVEFPYLDKYCLITSIPKEEISNYHLLGTENSTFTIGVYEDDKGAHTFTYEVIPPIKLSEDTINEILRKSGAW